MADGHGAIAFTLGLAWSVAATGATGCSPGRRASPDAGPAAAAASASTGSSASPAPRPSREVVERPPRPSCRAVTVEGDALPMVLPVDGGAASVAGRIHASDELPPDLWIDLAHKAHLTAEDPRTTRETVFFGPARIRACVGHREESWIATGAFESEHGAGETPGAEEWVATPNALVRYAAAKLRIEVSPGETKVNLGNGVAFVWPANDAHAETGHAPGHTTPDAGVTDGWQRLEDGGMRVVATGKTPPVEGARSSVDACAEIAARSERLTRALLAPAGDASDEAGTSVIVEQVSTRRLARAACAIAAVRVHALPLSPARTELAQRLHEADEAWTALPIAARTP